MDNGAVANPSQAKKGNGSDGGFGLIAASRNKQGPSKSGAETVSVPVAKDTNKHGLHGVVKKRLLLISQLKKAENGKALHVNRDQQLCYGL